MEEEGGVATRQTSSEGPAKELIQTRSNMSTLQRSWSLPLELDTISSTAFGNAGSAHREGISSVTSSQPCSPQESDDDPLDWLFSPNPNHVGSSRTTHRSGSWLSWTRMAVRNLKRGTNDIRRRFRISMFSIVRTALLFALLNLVCVALYHNYKSTFRETRLRHELRGQPGRSWIFSHNDEEHGEDAHHLAMDLGVGAIEVDVWLGESAPRDSRRVSGSLPGGGWAEWDLLVGHRQAETSRERTLSKVYLEPLLTHCERWEQDRLSRSLNTSAVFDQDRELYLVMDLKHQGETLFYYLERALQPLLDRGYLTTYDPATSTWHTGFIRVIGTGETPLSRVIHQYPRYIFYDAPLLSLSEEHIVPATPYSEETTIRFTPEISPIASAKLPLVYHLGMLFPRWRPLNPFIELLQAYSNEARRNGIEPRWWGYAQHTMAIRKKMWKLLATGGSSWINTDDLVGATRWLIKREKKQKKLEQLQVERGKTL